MTADTSSGTRSRPPSASSMLAYAVGLLSLTATLAAFATQYSDPAAVDNRYDLQLLDALLPATMAVTGTLIASRRPANPIGWLFLFSAAWGAFGTLQSGYLRHTLVAVGPTYVPPAALQSASFWGWVPLVIPVVAFVPMYFPTGRLLSRRWRPMPVLGLLGAVGVSLAIAVSPADHQANSGPGSAYGTVYGSNPYAVDAPWVQPLLIASFGLLLVSILLAVASLIARMRRGTSVERQQLKVFFYAAVLWPFLVVPAGLTGSPVLQFLVVVGIAAVPVAVAIAILRYRLYEIDVLIRRTLTYAILSAMLLIAYLFGVGLMQLVLAPITSGNGVAVAISTLAVIAVFQPLRQRVQTVVDRRFFRRKFNAAHALDDFGVQLRDVVDLGALEAGLLAVVEEAMQPVHASIWLRHRGDRPTRPAM